MWVTYCLINPVSPLGSSIFYVGLTNNIVKRYTAHISLSEANREKNAIIGGLISQGILPYFRCLAINDNERAGRISERKWIDAFMEIGEPLCNAERTGRR